MAKLLKIIGEDNREYYFTPKTKTLKKVTQNGKIFWKKGDSLAYIPNNVRNKL